MNNMRWSEQSSSPHDGGAGAPTIKNHSVTHFAGTLYCFGGYDGRRNHNSLLLYSIREQRWFRPHHVGSGVQEQPSFFGDTTVLVTGEFGNNNTAEQFNKRRLAETNLCVMK
jgi:Kelch motif